jgi:hypothetical protein
VERRFSPYTDDTVLHHGVQLGRRTTAFRAVAALNHDHARAAQRGARTLQCLACERHPKESRESGRGAPVNRRNEAERVTVTTDQLGVSRIQQIEWSHPRLTRLSDAARLVYACLVDGCSTTARETLDSVELVWRNRYKARERYAGATEMREALDEICLAVEELIAAGLLILLDRSSIFAGWVMKPWENPPS